MTSAEQSAVMMAVVRARKAVGELNTSRTSEDIERIRKGVEHELETALRVFGFRWQEMDRAAEAKETVRDPAEQPDLWS